MKTIQEIFEDRTFENLREWAGEKIYHRGEEYVDRVSQLSRTSDGAVSAWVAGTDDYATMVSRDEQGDLEAFCTCPYSGYGPCKHVVAVLLVAADGAVDEGEDWYDSSGVTQRDQGPDLRRRLV